LSNRRIIWTILGVLLFSVIAVALGIIAFRWGQGESFWGTGGEATPAALGSPTAARPPALPPPIVTNTPTITPTSSPTRGPTQTPTPTPTQTPIPSPTPIIFDINDLGRLETTEFAMRTVIDLENDPSTLWEQLVGTDQLLLVAEGEVVAGFDLTKIPAEDITVDGTSVKLILPSPEILYSRIDNEKTYVYERRTGLLTKTDPSLESRARLLAEESLVEWAEERGIYRKAEESGRAYLENFLRSLGFTDIMLEVKEREL
jgi:hypothetical protein